MTDKLAFVGDVHGNLDALKGVLAALAERGNPHAVFLGDYINRGEAPAAVLEELLSRRRRGEVTLLAGNHEQVLLSALDSGDLGPFLKMGGATTIRSYLGRPVRPDVLVDFRAHLPSEHVDSLRSMPTLWDSDDIVAQHAPFKEPSSKFQVSAHVPVGLLPRITADSAQLDTGGGDTAGTGRLTALLWPSRDFIQVDARGMPVPGAR